MARNGYEGRKTGFERVLQKYNEKINCVCGLETLLDREGGKRALIPSFPKGVIPACGKAEGHGTRVSGGRRIFMPFFIPKEMTHLGIFPDNFHGKRGA